MAAAELTGAAASRAAAHNAIVIFMDILSC
jgi:hypothetical protein